MVWNDAFTLGLPAIDEQHALLFTMANRLLDHPDALSREEKVVDILTDLGKFLILHFQTEEAMMRQLGVPAAEFERHARAHNLIIDEYAELNLAVAHGRHHTATEIFAQVRTWLHDHLHSDDIKLRDYLPVRAV
jgi:hemerythrin-like metal-binding protein